MSRSLQTLNSQNKLSLWSERIQSCRSSGKSVKTWCRENGICEQTYYKWQRRIFEMTNNEARFAEVTPVYSISGRVAATIRTGSTEADIYNGADGATVEMLLHLLKLC